jgi:hypothetical protein
MKMWSLFSHVKIKEALDKALDSKFELTLWQHSTQQMFQYKAFFTEVGESNCTVQILDRVEEGSLNFNEALYIHCPKLDFIFKRDKFKFDTGELSFKTPSELMVKERRRIERFRFRYQDFKSVSFTYGQGEDQQRHTLNLIDLSTAGLSFVGTTQELKDIEEGDIVLVTHITDQELEGDCSGVVRSKVRFEEKEGLKERTNQTQNIRVGIEFDEAIESVSFKSVKSIVERTQKRTKGLEVDGFNGMSDTEQLRAIRKIGEENKPLANHLLENTENLYRLRYLTSEMKQRFWMEVNQDLLAAALRLSTKELIYDLLGDVTENMRDEFLAKLNEPKPPSAIDKAQRQIIDFIHKKEREGVFVLSAKSFVKYV